MPFNKYLFSQEKKTLDEEVKKYEAKEEKREVKFNKCPHKEIEYVNGSIRCRCGVGWSGANLDKLFYLLTRGKK